MGLFLGRVIRGVLKNWNFRCKTKITPVINSVTVMIITEIIAGEMIGFSETFS